MRRGLKLFSEADEKRIADAITAVEHKTSGEIVAVVARDCDSYSYVPLMWAALLALLVPWVLIFFTWWPVTWVFLAQLLVFFLLWLVLHFAPVRYALVPVPLKRAHAHRRAVEQFLVQNLHTTQGRTGVLIFVSVAERYAEVLADVGIYQKVPKEAWQGIVDELTDHIGDARPAEGFIKAIEATGALLAKHFPPGSHDPNQLPNHLIVLS